MTDQQIPKCPYGCGAGGTATDCSGRPCIFDHPMSFIDWECKSYQQWGHDAVQSPECKDRVIALRDAEIERLRKACKIKDQLIKKSKTANKRHQRNKKSWARKNRQQEAEIKQLKADNTELRRLAGEIRDAVDSDELELLADASGVCAKTTEAADAIDAYLKKTEAQS